MTKEEMNKLMIEFKTEKRTNPKVPVNATLDSGRLKRIYDALSERGDFFHFLSKSEKLDLALYFLERFMSNSDLFSIQTPEIIKSANSEY